MTYEQSEYHVIYWTSPGPDWPRFRLSRRYPCLGIFGAKTCGRIDMGYRCRSVRLCTDECNPHNVFDHGCVLLQRGRPVVMVGYPYLAWEEILDQLRGTCDRLGLYIDRHPISPYGFGTTCFYVATRDTHGLHLLSRARPGFVEIHDPLCGRDPVDNPPEATE